MLSTPISWAIDRHSSRETMPLVEGVCRLERLDLCSEVRDWRHSFGTWLWSRTRKAASQLVAQRGKPRKVNLMHEWRAKARSVIAKLGLCD